MSELFRLNQPNQDRPSSSLMRQGKPSRSVARYQDASLEMQLEAILVEEQARNYTRFVENRVADAHDVLTFAKSAIRDDMDRSVILPIVEAYGEQVEQMVRKYGGGRR